VFSSAFPKLDKANFPAFTEPGSAYAIPSPEKFSTTKYFSGPSVRVYANTFGFAGSKSTYEPYANAFVYFRNSSIWRK